MVRTRLRKKPKQTRIRMADFRCRTYNVHSKLRTYNLTLNKVISGILTVRFWHSPYYSTSHVANKMLYLDFERYLNWSDTV